MKQCLLVLILISSSLGQLPTCEDVGDNSELCTLVKDYPEYPVTVHTSIDILEFMRINEDEKSLKVYFLLSMKWNDTGVKLANPNGSLVGGEYEIPANKYDDILWKKQSIFWVNSLKTGKEAIYGMGGFDYFWHEPPHFFKFADVMTQKISCVMEFGNFPFDHHVCDMVFYNSQHAYNKVIMAPVILGQDIRKVKLNEGELGIKSGRLPYKITAECLNATTVKSMTWLRSGAGIRFYFARSSIGLLVGGYYGPTAIFALLSLVSYIIKPEIVPGRMGLLITLFLILTNVYNSVKAPMSRGFSLIEVWLLGTSFPILAAIIEYAYIMFLQNNKSSKMFGKELEDHSEYLKKVDQIAFLSASVYLLIFFLIYWVIALTL